MVAIDQMLWLLAGALLGSVAGLFLDSGWRGVALNIAAGSGGALLAGSIVAPLVGVARGDPYLFSPGALAVALIGAIIVLDLVNIVRRGSIR